MEKLTINSNIVAPFDEVNRNLILHPYGISWWIR